MSSNVSGGILLLLLGALIISVGVSDKGKQIFNILFSGTPATTTTENKLPTGAKDTGVTVSGGLPGTFGGEKGAKSLNG